MHTLTAINGATRVEPGLCVYFNFMFTSWYIFQVCFGLFLVYTGLKWSFVSRFWRILLAVSNSVHLVCVCVGGGVLVAITIRKHQCNDRVSTNHIPNGILHMQKTHLTYAQIYPRVLQQLTVPLFGDQTEMMVRLKCSLYRRYLCALTRDI